MRRCAALLVSVVVWGAAFTPAARVAPAQEPARGGAFRIGVPYFQFTDGFDPTGEYLAFAWGIYSNLLLRTLVTYKHVEGPEGAVLVPDLATEVPEPSDGGTTYTFELKNNLRFAPPVNRGITSHDIEYAFERIATPELVAQYRYYYDPAIEGLHAFYRGRADDITGIETPDDRTIVFHLARPAGDFLHRLAMPATAPIPEEVARCAKRAGDYGRYVIASGPYMIEGSEDLVIDDGCSAMKRLPGFNPDKRLVLGRNPNYDSRSDSEEVRETFPDEWHFRVFDTGRAIWRRIEDGRLESAAFQVHNRVVERYESDPELEATVHTGPLDRTWYLTMNLTQPPFDDIHVRRAVNLAMDKTAMREAWGGPIAGDIATHILPPNITGGRPDGSEYDPYSTQDHRGDVEAARAEMSLSSYDSDGDGICDSEQCEDVRALNRNYGPWMKMQPVIEEQLRAIGIDVEVRERVDFYTPVQTVERNVPIGFGPGWGKDYPDAHTFMPWLFHSRKILCHGNTNYSLVGATPATQRECDSGGNYEDLPSVDRLINECERVPLGADRDQCWIDLDAHLMEEVVPWVPYLWHRAIRLVGPSVTKYGFDQFSGELAYAHMAVDESRQKDSR